MSLRVRERLAHSAWPNLLLCIPFLFAISGIIKRMCARDTEALADFCFVIEKMLRATSARWHQTAPQTNENKQMNDWRRKPHIKCRSVRTYAIERGMPKTIWMRRKSQTAWRNQTNIYHFFSAISHSMCRVRWVGVILGHSVWKVIHYYWFSFIDSLLLNFVR